MRVLQALQVISEKEALLAVLQAALAHLDYVLSLVVPLYLSLCLLIDRNLFLCLHQITIDYLCLPQSELVTGKHRDSFDIRKPSKNVSTC